MTQRTAVQYILEIEQNGRVTRSFALPPVARVNIDKAPSNARRWTLGGSPVKQKSGFRQARISISGVSGNRPRRGGEGGAIGTGDQIFLAYVRFLEEYEANGAVTEGPLKRNTGARQRLIFRSIKSTMSGLPNTDTFAYYCEVERNPQSHDTDNLRMQWGYQLNLITEGEVKREVSAPYGTPAQQAESASKSSGLSDELTNAATVNDPATGLSNLVPPTADAAVRYGSLVALQKELPTRFAQFRAPVRDFIRALNTGKQVAGVIRSVVGLPRNVISDIADAAATAVELLESLWDAIPGPERSEGRNWFNKAYAGIEAARISAIAEIGLSNRKLPGRGTNAGTSLTNGVQARNGQVVRSAEIVGDETLTEFCGRVLGDSGRYREVMDLNDMASPFEAANGVPLSAGMALIVPAPVGVNQTPRDTRDLFGTDLLVVDGDLVLSGTTDIALVRDRPNLEQALIRRLEAVRGENQAFPTWGMPKLVGEPAVVGTAGYIASQVREQIEADSRVQRVEDVIVIAEGGSYAAKFGILAVDGDVTQVVAPIPA